MHCFHKSAHHMLCTTSRASSWSRTLMGSSLGCIASGVMLQVWKPQGVHTQSPPKSPLSAWHFSITSPSPPLSLPGPPSLSPLLSPCLSPPFSLRLCWAHLADRSSRKACASLTTRMWVSVGLRPSATSPHSFRRRLCSCHAADTTLCSLQRTTQHSTARSNYC
jgi:hypothetical protein